MAFLMDDRQLLHEEYLSLKAELKWILSPETGEVQAVFTELQRLVTACHQRLSWLPDAETHVSPGDHPVSYHTSPLTTTNDSVKGLVGLNGYCISRASLQLKFPRWNKGQVFCTQIYPNHPWVVHQIHDTTNYLSLLKCEISTASKQHLMLSKMDQSANGAEKHLLQTRDCVLKVMDRSMALLNNAKDKLLSSHRRTVAEAATELSNQGVWHPRMGPGLVVDFHIDYGNLVTSIYTLREISAQPSPIRPIHCKIEHQWYEVEDRVRLESSIPALADSVAHINTAYELCQRLKDNLNALILKDI